MTDDYDESEIQQSQCTVVVGGGMCTETDTKQSKVLGYVLNCTAIMQCHYQRNNHIG